MFLNRFFWIPERFTTLCCGLFVPEIFREAPWKCECSPALIFHTNDNNELESFTDVAIDERIESEVTGSKFRTEEEENSPLMNC